jgi:chromosome segregation ATPase
LSGEFLSELENKIDTLLSRIQSITQEKNGLETEAKVCREKHGDLETQNQKLKNELDSLRKQYEETEKKLDDTAERIQGLLTKLESV